MEKNAPSKKDAQQELSIRGMTCASCVRRVEGTLRNVEGVRDVSVNLATHRAQIFYLRGETDIRKLIEAVSAAGYEAKILENGATTNFADEALESLRHSLKRKILLSAPIAILLVWATFPGIMHSAPDFLHLGWVQLLLAAPVQFWAGADFYRNAFRALKHRLATMDTLVVLGTSVAFFYSSFVAFFPSVVAAAEVSPMPYFDASVVIILFVLIGRFLEDRAKERTSSAIRRLLSLEAKTARRVQGAEEVDVPIETIALGDILRVRPGEKIPVDGEVTDGASAINEAMVTGESIPVEKGVDSEVIGGTLNTTGTFLYRATRIGKDSTLARIVKLVEQAQGSKAEIQRLADSVASYFVPTVLILSAITFVLWALFGPEPALTRATINAVAVLIVACPCAMGLATPTAIMVAAGRGADSGILVKNAPSLERLHSIDTVVFDKTGTLTEGNLEVTDIIPFGEMSENDILSIASTLEKGSEHPLAEAILKQAELRKILLDQATEFSAIPGKGVRGLIHGIPYQLGNRGLLQMPMGTQKKQKLESLAAEGKTVVLLAKESSLVGMIAAKDKVRTSARSTIEWLRELGISSVLLTGDNESTAKRVAEEIGIKEVYAQTLPHEKAARIQLLRTDGKKVAMVGDGVNDAPALAAADVGIALSSGTDVAMDAADITLLHRDLTLVPQAILLARATIRTIRMNLLWAFGYNALLIPLAMGALYPMWGLLLDPMLASAAMALSSVFVVGNSLRLRTAELLTKCV
jgi:Cu+-exporting ATPase